MSTTPLMGAALAMSAPLSPLLPGQSADGKPVTLGVMGGGQLARMFVHAAQAMGYATAVLDPDPASPVTGQPPSHSGRLP